MMTFEKPENILIITHDLKLNRTFTKRYFSFIKALKARHHLVKGVGIDFTFNPHPINNLDKVAEDVDIEDDIITIRPKNLNFIQKLLTLSDRCHLPFFFKKYLLALHIIVYKTDQWVANINDFECIKDFKPTIIIAGGGGGIIETAFKLSKKYNAKLFLDYRDPWNFGYHLLETNRAVYWFKKKFTVKKELNYLSSADQIITVSESLKAFFPERFYQKITVIENGSNFEYEDVHGLISNFPKLFNIVYLGTVYDQQLNDKTFFIALKKFIHKNGIQPQSIQLYFLGSFKNTLLPKLLNKYSLQEFTRITKRLNTIELKSKLLNASLFLQLRYDERSEIITSKQADYLMFRKPILLPNSDNGDIAESILNNEAGYVCDGKVESIVKVLQFEYDKFLRGESNKLENRDFSYLSRSKIAEKLLDIIP